MRGKKAVVLLTFCCTALYGMCFSVAFFCAICLLLENIRFYRWIVVLKFSNAGVADLGIL